jgi:predicted lipoprotein
MIRKNIILLFFTSLLLVNCGGSDDESQSDDIAPIAYDRAKMLVHWADKIILPAHSSFKQTLIDLDNSTKSFVAVPNQSNLDDIRSKWLISYKSWQHIEMFDIGKSEEIYFKSKMNSYPAFKTRIENNIMLGNTNFDDVSNYSSQGFPALDYMLFGIASDDTNILNKYTGGSDYSNYLTSLVNKMLNSTNSVINDWTDYRTSFISSTDNTASSSVNKLINDFIFYYEKGLRANKVGIPAGVFSGNPLMENVEAFYNKEVSKDLLLNALDATIKFYNGTSYDGLSSGPSLKSYLTHLNSSKDGSTLAALIASKLETAKSQINTLSNNFINQIESDNNKMLVTYDAIQSVVVLFKVDMLQAFSINVDYTDADGD